MIWGGGQVRGSLRYSHAQRLAAWPLGRAGRLTAQRGRLVTVVQTVIVAVALPALLDTAAVGAGKLARLALRWGHVGWVRCGHHRSVRGKVRPRPWDRC